MKYFMKLLGIFAVMNVLAAGRDNVVCTNMCAGNNVSCTHSNVTCKTGQGSGVSGLNATGDIAHGLRVPNGKTHNLGLITSRRTFRFEIPAPGDRVVYQVRFSQGNYQNQQIRMLAIHLDLNKPVPADLPKKLQKEIDGAIANPANTSFKYMLIVYRQTAGSKGWTEVAHAMTANPVRPTDATLDNEGNLSIDGFEFTTINGTRAAVKEWTTNLTELY